MVRKVEKHESKVDAVMSSLNPLFMLAVATWKTDAVYFLMSKYIEAINSTNISGIEARHAAS